MGPTRKMRECGVFICEKKLISKFTTPFKNMILVQEHWVSSSSHFFCSINTTEDKTQKECEESVFILRVEQPMT